MRNLRNLRNFKDTIIGAFACVGIVAIFLGILEASGVEIEPKIQNDCVCEVK